MVNKHWNGHVDNLTRHDFSNIHLEAMSNSPLSAISVKRIDTPSPHVIYTDHLHEIKSATSKTLDADPPHSSETASRFIMSREACATSDFSDDGWRHLPTYTHQDIERVIEEHDWLSTGQSGKTFPSSNDE